MAIGLSILFIIFACIGLKTEKKIVNPITVFCGLWGMITFFSALHLYRMYEPDNKTYYWIAIGVCAFFFGYYITKLATAGNRGVVFRKRKKKQNTYKIDYQLNYKLVYFMLLFCLPFYLKDLMSIINHIGAGNSLSSVQALMQSGDDVFVRSRIESAIRLLIINPFMWICIPITVVDFWVGKRDKFLITLTLTIMTIRILSTGGRASFIHMAFYFVCVYTMMRNDSISGLSERIKNSVRKNKKMFLSVMILGVVVLGLMTYSRAGRGAFRSVYYDFAMQPMMLQIWAKISEKNPLGFGMASLDGFLYPIEYFMRNTIHVSLPDYYQDINNLVNLTDTQWQWVGSGVCANAYVSCFWFFYTDARVLGIAIGSFIYGIFGRCTFGSAQKKLNQKSLAIYCMAVIGIFYTFGRFEFSQMPYTLGFIYLFLFFYRRKRVVDTSASAKPNVVSRFHKTADDFESEDESVKETEEFEKINSAIKLIMDE